MRGVQIVVPVVFLPEKAGVGQQLGKAADQQLLHPAVVLGHHIPVAGLALGQHALGVQQQLSGLALRGAHELKNFTVAQFHSGDHLLACAVYHKFLRL